MGDSPTRSDDVIAARQEPDLEPRPERLDQLILRLAGVDQSVPTDDSRPLWQMHRGGLRHDRGAGGAGDADLCRFG